MKKNLLVFMTSLLFAIKAFAGVSVSPVQMFIDNPNKQRSTTLTLESVDETEKRVFEALRPYRCMRRTWCRPL